MCILLVCPWGSVVNSGGKAAIDLTLVVLAFFVPVFHAHSYWIWGTMPILFRVCPCWDLFLSLAKGERTGRISCLAQPRSVVVTSALFHGPEFSPVVWIQQKGSWENSLTVHIGGTDVLLLVFCGHGDKGAYTCWMKAAHLSLTVGGWAGKAGS